MKKVVLISGASTGFGRYIAKLLSSNNFKVYGTSRNPNKYSDFEGIELLKYDLTTFKDSKKIVDKVKKEKRPNLLEEEGQEVLKAYGLPLPTSALAKNEAEAVKIANKIGFPVVIRPSFVLGGRGMEIIYNIKDLKLYLDKVLSFSNESILIDQYLTNAIEVDVDAICDGESVFIAGIMEHIEEAGIHSGDSACVVPTQSLSKNILNSIDIQTKKIALELKVKGLINIQFAIKDDKIYLLEVNPRASRTVPFIAKAIGLPIAKILH